MEHKKPTSGNIIISIWFYTAVVLSCGVCIYCLIDEGNFLYAAGALIAFTVGSLACSVPALIVLYCTVPQLEHNGKTTATKFNRLFFILLIIAALYGLVAGILFTAFNYTQDTLQSFLQAFLIVTTSLFGSAAFAVTIKHTKIKSFLQQDILDDHFLYATQQHTTNMESEQPQSEHAQQLFANDRQYVAPPQNPMNKIFIKAGITAFLIILMLVPMGYIQGLITERKERQESIIDEVSSKWADAQTVTPPYLVIPYKTNDTSAKKEKLENIVLLPQSVQVKGNIDPEKRHRSNYDVLLYRSKLNINGTFAFSLPKNINPSNLVLSEAKICVGISDFKGIEQQVTVNINNVDISLTPGLPVNIDSNGLSAPVELTAESLTKTLPFALTLNLKGSRQLHFMPLSANSSFELSSAWQNPSFDGSTLPIKSKDNGEDNGFPAKWNFNSANLPFATVLSGGAIKPYKELAFGVSLLQPADQYVKAMRSVKYAILIIGLTFALFFIIELLQQKPVHPVQYVLVGLALVIFYCLLVSFSEYVLFDYAYLIAALATVILITLYTKSHFKNWKTAGIFFGLLSGLYGFIFVLISLEDTALLAGSIALFVVLALVMYASRKINWYAPSLNKTAKPLQEL